MDLQVGTPRQSRWELAWVSFLCPLSSTSSSSCICSFGNSLCPRKYSPLWISLWISLTDCFPSLRHFFLSLLHFCPLSSPAPHPLPIFRSVTAPFLFFLTPLHSCLFTSVLQRGHAWINEKERKTLLEILISVSGIQFKDFFFCWKKMGENILVIWRNVRIFLPTAS